MTLTADLFSNMAAVMAAVRRAARNLVPAPPMLPSVWAAGDPAQGIKANIHIAIGNAIPGPINFDNAPYQRGMVDVIKEPGVRRVSYKMAAQTGKTTVQQVITGFFIEHEPRSQIFLQPSQGDIQTFRETKLLPMLEANPSISSKMAKPRGRTGVNNGRIISFIGGWLMFSWAGSPKTLRGRSAPVVHADEIDGFTPLPEGDAGELLGQRTATFGDQALRTESSTPTVKSASRIDVGYDGGDQRQYHVACPDCGEAQFFKWQNVTWRGRVSTGIDDFEEDIGKEHFPESATYACEHCGSTWNDGQRIAAIRNAEKQGHGWKASKPFRGHASFTGTEMLSTFRRLRDIVQSYLDKIALGDMQSFVNVSLGQSYEEKGEKADPDSLLARAQASTYVSGQVPMGGVYLVAGIDQQGDRLEVETVAYGVGEESWSIDYSVLWGDPLGSEVWAELEDYLAQTFQHESGAVLPISAACLDTGGTNGMTQAAYGWLRGKTGRRIFGIKGVPGWGRGIVEKAQRKQSGKNARKIDLFLVGVDEAKLVTMRRLAVANPGPNYCHFPQDRAAEYFKGLTAEKMLIRYVKGQPIREWHKPDRARNEPLDCRNYALAALKIMQPNFKRLSERLNVSSAKPKVIKMTETADKAPQPLPASREPAEEKLNQIQLTAAVGKTPEIPQEEPEPPPPKNRIIRPKRVLQQQQRKRNWATKW